MSQWISPVIGMTLGCVIMYFVRLDKMLVRHAVTWLFIACCLIVLGVFPGWIDSLGKLAGVSYPPMLAILLGYCALLLKLLFSDLEASRLEVRLIRAAQRLSILEAHLKALKAQDAESKPHTASKYRELDPPN